MFLKTVWLLIFILTPLVCLSQEEWPQQKKSPNWLELNPLRFTNRARCALDSKKPTTSAFLLIDNNNLGRSLHRLAKQLGKDDNFTVEGLYRFRYSVLKMVQIITSAMMKGQLPILPSNTDNSLKNYSSKVLKCEMDEGYCDEIDEYISTLWEKLHHHVNLNKIDSFTDQNIFLNQQASSIGCYYLKQFSPLEAHLYGTKPKKEVLDQIAKAVENNNEYVAHCEDFNQQTDLKQALYQIDLTNIENSEWQEKGFDFWNSLKIYLSWASRFSPELEKLAYPYASFLKNVDIEETIYFFPNGCSSIEKPECSRESLSLNSLRVLSQTSGASELGRLEVLNYVSNGPSRDLVSNSTPEVNTDILELADYPSASAWADNFRENLSKVRGFVKLKLSRAVNQLNIINDHLTIEKILHDIEAKHKIFELKQMSQKEEFQYRQELYYLCSEYQTAMDERFSFLRDDLLSIKKQNSLMKTAYILSEKDLVNVQTFLDFLPTKILNYCQTLEKQKTWNDDFILNPDGYAPWFKEYAKDQKVVKNDNLLSTLVNYHKPILSLQNLQSDNSHIICLNGLHCSRKILANIIDLHSSLQYIEGLINLSGIKSPSIFNPYSERVACGVYDPWFKTRKTIFDFIKDMAAAALWTYAPTPIYVDVNIKPKEVTSLDQLIKDGKVYYDPKFSKKRLDGSLFLDLGPLTGAPCMISISSQTNTKHPAFYYFNGISTQVCKETDHNRVDVYTPSEIQPSRLSVSGCVTCTISLTSAIGSTSAFIPILKPVYFVLQGVVRLVTNLKDPHDIPRSWETDVNRVYRSHRKFGEIKKSCVRKLRNGGNCLKNSCESRLIESFEKNFKKYVSMIDLKKGGWSEFYVNHCSSPIKIKTPLMGCAQKKFKPTDFIIPSNCTTLFQRTANENLSY